MLRTRLYIGLLPLLLLFMAAGMAAMMICRELAQSVEKRLVGSYSLMISGYAMRDAAGMITTAIHDAQNGRVLEAKSQFSEYKSKFQRNLMDQSFASAGTPRAAAVARVADAYDRLIDYGTAVFERNSGSSMAAYQQTEAAFFQTLRALEELTQHDYDDLQAEQRRVSRIVRRSINILAVALVVGILLSLFLSYRLARSLLRPIQLLTVSATALGEGQLERDVPVTSDDELGELARSFNIMAAKLRAYREATTAKVVTAQRTMEATLASTPDPLFVVNREAQIVVRNPAAESLASRSEFGNGFPEPIAERLKQVLSSGAHFIPSGYDQVVTVEVDRTERHYLPRILAIGDELSGFGGAAMILQDVTKFRLLDDAKSNLVGTVSHELKTPLTSLRMAIYLLLEKNLGALSKSQQELLETARDDADRLIRILNDILDLARLESGVSSLNKRDVAVAGLLEDMVREIKPITDSADQIVKIEIAENTDSIFVDPERLRHVFINLLANASKYSPSESTITLYARPDEVGGIRFGVRDQGPGIPEESVPYIFEKFYRVPGQTKKGAGLGLTIAREIVVAHGGTIGCTSKEGQGSDFFFNIPQRAA
ncbi:MAG TPA: ATP-binding protein [Opitutaceae bacterium]|nr:ATP-binding protein [Opitutaceae bacterium]